MLNLLATSISTLGVGFSPKAPGTVGSVLAGGLWWYFYGFMGLEAILFVFFLGWLATHFYEKLNNRHDPKEVIIDEVVGLWITLYMAPPKLSLLLFGFLLFRLFDIWKPFPVGWIDRKVPGALGTMLDDVAAGVMGWICLQISVTVMERYGIFL